MNFSSVFKTIEADFKSRGLVLEQLLIRNINLPASVKLLSKVKLPSKMPKMCFRKKNKKKSVSE
jgi:hypothetical protein